MKVGTLAFIMVSSVLMLACTKTQFQFGQPYETGVMHDDLGNVHENTPLDPLIPISANTQPTEPQLDTPNKTEPKKLTKKAQVATPETGPNETLPPTTTLSNWEPNEALLIRGTELIQGLQRELGKKPTPAQMAQRLQSHMGLSGSQAQVLISMLGVL